jgi:hypothetical protein
MKIYIDVFLYTNETKGIEMFSVELVLNEMQIHFQSKFCHIF